MQAKSDSNYVAVTRHRKFIGRNRFISSCPPILRAIASDHVYHHQPHISTRLDDDDIWFSSMTSFGGTGVPSNYHSSGNAASAAADYGDTANDGANIAGTAGGVGGSDDLMSPHNNNPMIMESSEDITAVAPHSSVSAIVSYNERRRREDGWNDLGLETILRTNASTNGNTLLLSSSSNVVPFSSDGGGGGGGGDADTANTDQQGSTTTNNNNDDD